MSLRGGERIKDSESSIISEWAKYINGAFINIIHDPVRCSTESIGNSRSLNCMCVLFLGRMSWGTARLADRVPILLDWPRANSVRNNGSTAANWLTHPSVHQWNWLQWLIQELYHQICKLDISLITPFGFASTWASINTMMHCYFIQNWLTLCSIISIKKATATLLQVPTSTIQHCEPLLYTFVSFSYIICTWLQCFSRSLRAPTANGEKRWNEQRAFSARLALEGLKDPKPHIYPHKPLRNVTARFRYAE